MSAVVRTVARGPRGNVERSGASSWGASPRPHFARAGRLRPGPAAGSYADAVAGGPAAGAGAVASASAARTAATAGGSGGSP
ncbi:hypothetical protein GCM10023170_025520 [Phytohabitans houttuyneae]